MTTEVRVPTLGESVTEATVATWFKKPGDSVDVDEMLCELETDKVTVEVPSPVAGKLADIVANEGDTVGVDALLANIAPAGEAGSTTVEERPSAKSSDEAPAASGDDAPVDVMVRTSGEQRVSNFLLWQGAGAKIHFTDTAWPDFDADELDRAIALAR